MFTSRSRRPPLDNVNALLSFAYSLLASDCAAAQNLYILPTARMLTIAVSLPILSVVAAGAADLE